MKCEQFEDFFRNGLPAGNETQERILEHIRSCKTCRGKYSPVSDLVTETITPIKSSPRKVLATDAFWIFFVPTIIGIVGLAIFLVFVR